MARGTTLETLLDQLRAETRLSLNPAHNTQARDGQVNLIQRTQERLWNDFTWPHLRRRTLVPVEAGLRWYPLPAGLHIDRIESIEVLADGEWQPLEANISDQHFAAFNSDLDQRSWPPRRWQISTDDAHVDEVEIWPIADQDQDAPTLEGTLRFIGIRALNPLVEDDDVADLDDRLIVLYAAAEMLGGSGAKDAKLKLDTANQLYQRLRAGLTPSRRFMLFDTGQPPPRRRTIAHWRP